MLVIYLLTAALFLHAQMVYSKAYIMLLFFSVLHTSRENEANRKRERFGKDQ